MRTKSPGGTPSSASQQGFERATFSTISEGSDTDTSSTNLNVYRLPHADILPQILTEFFKNSGRHFPFLSREVIEHRLKDGEASSFLINSMAALASRVCPFPVAVSGEDGHSQCSWRKATPFVRKAKEQLVPLSSITSSHVVTGLLILSWADSGDSNEAG